MSEEIEKKALMQSLLGQEIKQEIKERKEVNNTHLDQSHVPTDETRQAVMAMRLADIPVSRIAKVLGVTSVTLTKHYAYEIEVAKDQIDTMVMSKLIDQIEKGNPKLIEFYLKTRKRWTEKQEHVIEHKAVRTKEEIEQELRMLGVPEEKLKEI